MRGWDHGWDHGWTKTVGIATGCWAVAWGAGDAVGLRPHPVPVAVVVLAVAVLVRQGSVLARTEQQPRWTAHRMDDTNHVSGDQRSTRLHRMLVDAVSSGSAAVELRTTLAALVDDRLLDHHGICRQTDPDRAAALLGPDLDRLLRTPVTPGPAARTRTAPTPAELAVLIDRIESL